MELLRQSRRLHIRMQDPLKQGLKLIFFTVSGSSLPDSNARSTKTRIETGILG